MAAAACLAGAGFLAVGVFDLFGDDDGGRAAVDARYCRLAGDLERVSLNTGAASAPGVYDGAPEKIRAAVDQMGETLEELRSAAPRAIGPDVGAMVDALKGDARALRTEHLAATALRVSRYQAAYCSGGSGNTDGD